jgi:hypothetical protein
MGLVFNVGGGGTLDLGWADGFIDPDEDFGAALGETIPELSWIATPLAFWLSSHSPSV